jgi:hypothetical protein
MKRGTKKMEMLWQKPLIKIKRIQVIQKKIEANPDQSLTKDHDPVPKSVLGLEKDPGPGVAPDQDLDHAAVQDPDDDQSQGGAEVQYGGEHRHVDSEHHLGDDFLQSGENGLYPDVGHVTGKGLGHGIVRGPALRRESLVLRRKLVMIVLLIVTPL